MILSSIGLDTLHPYATARPAVRHLATHDRASGRDNYARKDYYGVLAESWKFQGTRGCFA